MKLGNVIEFRKDLYFDGAVQADWFYDQKKAAKVAIVASFGIKLEAQVSDTRVKSRARRRPMSHGR